MSDPETSKAPLLAHLRELRKRLMIILSAYLVGVCVCYGYAGEIYSFLVQPLADVLQDDYARRMIYTGLTEAFFTYLKLALFAAFFLSFPVIAWQIYSFAAPGLYNKEKKLLLPYLVAAPALFLLGSALVYYGIFPVAWKFFLSFESAGGAGHLPIQLDARVSEYLSLVMHLILAFGISFQLPLILTLLCQFGMVSAATLAKGRRFAIVIIVAVAAVITPPDVFSQIALSVPLYALYEMSVQLCKWIERRRDATA